MYRLMENHGEERTLLFTWLHDKSCANVAAALHIISSLAQLLDGELDAPVISPAARLLRAQYGVKDLLKRGPWLLPVIVLFMFVPLTLL